MKASQFYTNCKKLDFYWENVTEHIIHLRVHDSHKSSEISKRNGTKIIHHYVVIENVNFSLVF